MGKDYKLTRYCNLTSWLVMVLQRRKAESSRETYGCGLDCCSGRNSRGSKSISWPSQLVSEFPFFIYIHFTQPQECRNFLYPVKVKGTYSHEPRRILGTRAACRRAKLQSSSTASRPRRRSVRIMVVASSLGAVLEKETGTGTGTGRVKSLRAERISWKICTKVPYCNDKSVQPTGTSPANNLI